MKPDDAMLSTACLPDFLLSVSLSKRNAFHHARDELWQHATRQAVRRQVHAFTFAREVRLLVIGFFYQ